MSRVNRSSRWVLSAILCTAAACRFSVDPNRGRFSCDVDGGAQCGADYECRPQVFLPRGLCYPLGQCVPEICDGTDNDCNGDPDDLPQRPGTACASGLPGVCDAGVYRCETDGGVFCQPNILPMTLPEVCDGLDNDCDALIDEDFDFATDNSHCGGCNRPCDAGTSCGAGVCRESACSDNLDNDLDGWKDCEDLDCQGSPCGAADGGTNCGSDAGVPDAGAPSLDGGVAYGVCLPIETACQNGLDDDGDGAADCADLDCDGKGCNSDGGVCWWRLCQ